MLTVWKRLMLSLVALFIGSSPGYTSKLSNASDVFLTDGWQIQSSRKVSDQGAKISSAAYRPSNWYPASVPTTVLAALVADKVYADPFFGMNLRSLPGVEYPIGEGFSNIMTPPESPFASSWWYRTQFNIPDHQPGKRFYIQFDGINFRANIWVNGHAVASSQQVAGTFRSYEFDITSLVKSGAANAIAVEVFPPSPHDLQLNWVDTNPTPPDKNMGLWRPVRIVATGPVEVRHADVISTLQISDMERAELKLTAELKNATDRLVKGVLHFTTDGITIEKVVELQAHEDRKLVLNADEFPQLLIHRPRIWWPVRMGKQELYISHFEFSVNGQISARQTVTFGIRNVSSELTPEGNLLYRVNGSKVLIRGAGWWGPDMLLRSSPERQAWELRYAVDLGLNAIRMDGKFEDQHFLELADQAGLMLLPGFACCDHWEHWSDWNAEDTAISAASLRDVILDLRTHPSVITWLKGDDNPPPPEYEKRYDAILAESDWPNTSLSSATERLSSVSGRTGVKMTGPYMWVPPIYWYTADQYHESLGDKSVQLGAFGFNTETTSTEAIPPIESIRTMLPESHVQIVDEYWDYHGGGHDFQGKDVRMFTKALNARYGTPRDIEAYAGKAQLMSYEAQRAMYEAFGRNKYFATGLLHEMLNSAWPSFIWNLYDFYLRPGGSYFGVKKACEPVHVQYSYDDKSIVVVNSLYTNIDNVHVRAEVYDLKLKKRFEFERRIDIAPDSSNVVFNLPDLKELTSTYFVHATLTSESGKIISTNFYWLSTNRDKLDWDKTTWMYTPVTDFADFTALDTLPNTKVHIQATMDNSPDGEDVVHATIENPSSTLAFFIRLKAVNLDSGEEILPILWGDNYVTLMPGETRRVDARFHHIPSKSLNLVATGMNVSETSVAIH